MTVNKITNPPSQKDIIDKVNEIIDDFTLDELANVNISNPTAGQNLTYDATSQVWKNTSTSATIAWGGITGTLSDQTDLKNALDGKYDASNPNGYTSNIGTVTSVNNVSPVGGNITLSIPTKTSDLTNDDGFITGITSSDVTTALGYTPYNSTNPNGYQANIIETVKVNGTALTPSSKAVDITVPTNNNQLTNGAGYITGISSSDVTTALGYTPYSSANPSGYQANVIETIKVNGTALTPSSKAVDITVPAAQVNSDWNASSGVAQILNKPTLATVATSGSYDDLTNTPTIPTVGNGTITFTQGGVTKGTITANQTGDTTIALDAGGGGSGLSYTTTNPAITPVDGVATWSVTHSLGTQTVLTALYYNGNKIEHNTLITSNNALTITFNASSTVTAGTYTIVVIAAGGTVTGADVNFANITDTAKIAIAHNAMPSSTYDDLTLGASDTTYTAPADGWFYLQVIENSGAWCNLFVDYNQQADIMLYAITMHSAGGGGYNQANIIPVFKNQTLTIKYDGIIRTSYFRFIYAVGSESEKV